MILGFLVITTFLANIWLSLSLGFPVTVGLGIDIPAGLIFFIASLPLVLLFSGSGAIAIGFVGTIFGKHDDRSKGKKFLKSFLHGWAWLTIIIWITPWLIFSVLKISNDHFPATLPRITISNGEKTVIFQSMMHIASPGFYRDIRRDMESLRDKDYVFFYEGVKKGTDESIKKLGQLIGTDVAPEMYDTLAEIAQLRFQGDDIFTSILPSTNVDLSTDEIVALAEKDTLPPPTTKQIDIAKKLGERYPTFTPLQKNITQVVARGAMNLLLRAYTDPRITQELKNTIPVFTIILDKRNAVIRDAIIASPSQNIYIHYGALHYAGVLKGLQEKDPRWREISRTEYTVIR